MTSKTFKIKPISPNTKVLDPVTYEPLKKMGQEKPRDEYWLRRLAEGDVVEVNHPKAKEE